MKPLETKCEALVKFGDGTVLVMLVLDPIERVTLKLFQDRIDFALGDVVEVVLKRVEPKANAVKP
jgi:hypothetical protein